MKRSTALLSAFLLVPALAVAQRRLPAARSSGGSASSFKTTYNHSAPAQSAPRPRSSATAPHHNSQGPAGRSQPAAAPMRSMRGGWSAGSHAPRRSHNGYWFSDYGSRSLPRTRAVRGVEGEGAPPPAEAPQGNDRTYLNTPGAFIRTEGLGYKVGPGGPERLHEIEGGGRVAADERYAQSLTTHRGLFTGPRDTPPSTNPGGTASGNNAITPNTIIDNSITGNGNNNGHNSNNGGQGNGNGVGGD